MVHTDLLMSFRPNSRCFIQILALILNHLPLLTVLSHRPASALLVIVQIIYCKVLPNMTLELGDYFIEKIVEAIKRHFGGHYPFN